MPINTCIQNPCQHGGTCHLSESQKDGFRYQLALGPSLPRSSWQPREAWLSPRAEPFV